MVFGSQCFLGMAFHYASNTRPDFLLSQLMLNSSLTPTTIAKYHKKKYGIFSDERRDPYLEIRPEGEHMVDLILVTFVFVEKTRQDNE